MKNAEDIPAGYTLEAAQSNLHVPTSGQSIDFVFSASITVGDDGTVSQPSSDYKSVYATNTYVSVLQSLLAGKFFTTRSLYAPGIEGAWYCPSNLTVSVSDNDIILSQAQKVNAHGIIPAGTTTTYPVSTNPNAYQEGSDAKPAGYTLGEAESGTFRLGGGVIASTDVYKKSASIDVSAAGTLSIPGSSYANIDTSSGSLAAAQSVVGNFITCTNRATGEFVKGTFWYIPSDATVAQTTYNGYPAFTVNKRQPVTGYAAIPAGTTIESLGKLGDKARVQVFSYVGTGIYGSSNPNSLTFDFVPKLLFIKNIGDSQYYICLTLFGTTLTDAYENYAFFDATGTATYPDSAYARKNGKNIQWYSTRSPYNQANSLGAKYVALAIG